MPFLRLLLLPCLWFGVVTLSALPSAPPRERGQPLLRMFAPRDYKAHEQIWKVVSRPDGIAYLGNLNKLVEFDGGGWRVIDVPGASYIRGLAVDGRGTVWLGGINELGQLGPGPDGRMVYVSRRSSVPAAAGEIGTIWCVHAMRDGVYFQSNAVVLRWDGARFDLWRMNDKATVLSFPFEGELWVSRAQAGLQRLRAGGEFETIAAVPEGFGAVRFVLRDAAGRVVLGSGTKGLWVLEDGQLRALATPIDAWLKSKKLYAAESLPDGRIVFTSLQGGALVVDADYQPLAHFDDTAGLGTDTVISSHLDARGVLWLGTDRGVARVEYSSPMTVFNDAHGLGRNGPESLQRDGERLIVANSRSVLEITPPSGERLRPLARDTVENTDRITNLLRQPDGVLAPGLIGLSWIQQGKSVKLDGPGGVRELLEIPGQPGRIVGTHLNGLASWRRAGASWAFEGLWPGFTGELRSLVADGKGGIWTSTPNAGAIRFEADPAGPRAVRIERYAEEAGLPVSRTRVWITPVGGAPLFGTEKGLYRFDAETRRFSPETGYGRRFADGSTVVRLVAEDDQGGLWLARELRGDGPAELLYGRAGVWAAMPMPDINRLNNFNFLAWERVAGREVLWVGGQAEMRRLDITSWRQQPPPPIGSSVIRTIAAARGRWLLPAGGKVQLPATENSLRFTFATPGLGGEPDAQHETCLHGFADGEVLVSAMGERTFTNLPPGDYQFEVRGRSADGRWSEPARFAFTVLAPWWATPWARAGYVLAGGLVLAAYIRWRIRRLTRERNRLEAIVADRTVELAEKNRELERLHRMDQDEKLAARLAEEKAQLELLRYQLNPHFLYNSLNSIRALVYTNAEAAGEMVTRLSEFCRWTLTRGADGMTTVAEEIEMLQAYLDIERTRWQDGLKARIEVDPAARQDPLPQFLFLPLLENAIKYGGRTSPSVLEVVMSVRLEDNALVCEISNTGHWIPGNGHGQALAGVESTRIGLENLRRRLARHYGPECRPEVVTMPGWVCVRLRLSRKPARPGSASPL